VPELDIPQSFKRNLRKKTKQQQARILECLHKLGVNPRHPGLHTSKVRGVTGVFEAYVDGANRVTWEWTDDGAVRLRVHCNHDITSRGP
jgi:hypothetical protein